MPGGDQTTDCLSVKISALGRFLPFPCLLTKTTPLERVAQTSAQSEMNENNFQARSGPVLEDDRVSGIV